MDRSKLKAYAPKARRDFIRAVTDRAAIYGLTEKNIEPVTEKGDVAIIAGKAYPISVVSKRRALEERIKRQGFGQTMEACAYTWFNRLVAVRFMELHGYLDHGYQVLSHPEGHALPEIVEHAEHVDLPGLDKQKVIELKLDGTKEEELYRLLLVAQCNALHSAMPFLFERIDDETELLLPENLLHSDSLIRQLVGEIDEEDWQEVEIIGWLYQFYISEKKDEVIGKVVASEDIPAATQLFTPNWIVKYLVQNTLGRQWLATYPQSSLKGQMEYYIEPAEQTPEVQARLAEITPNSLNPEELTLLDPACGSGHILVEAYDIFKTIYQERGYRAKDIPALILQKNVFGVEIDERAAQLAAFALMMKARADDRRIFDSEAKPNVLAFQESKGMNATDITHALNSPILKEELPQSEYLFEEMEEAETPLFGKKALAEKGHISQSDIASLLELFENAKTFGSLIQVPSKLAAKLPEIEQRLNDVLKYGDLTFAPANVIKPLLQQARLLTQQYDAVVANPPYMGSKAMNMLLKEFASTHHQDTKSDTFAMFIERGFGFTKPLGSNAMVTMQSWMFLSSYEVLRSNLLRTCTTYSLTHMANNVMGIAFGTAATVWFRRHIPSYRASFCFVSTEDLGSNGTPRQFPVPGDKLRSAVPDKFAKLPGQVFCYWVSDTVSDYFVNNKPLKTIGDTRQGMATTDNDRFLRYWHEVSNDNVFFRCKSTEEAKKSRKRWFPYNKGGAFRKWFGNAEYVINWLNDGEELVQLVTERYGSPSKRITSKDRFFQSSISWSKVSSGELALRYFPEGFIFDVAGCSIFFGDDEEMFFALALLNSNVTRFNIKLISPTINYEAGHLGLIPLPPPSDTLRCELAAVARQSVLVAERDWNAHECSWDFLTFPWLEVPDSRRSVSESWMHWKGRCEHVRDEQRLVEERVNAILCHAYGLKDEVPVETPESEITLHDPNRQEDIKRLLSYAIGCMMGRYSLDKPGLIYAHSRNKGFDSAQYKTFPADQDGIIPLTDTAWFDDDVTNRVIEFIGVAWPKEHLEENLNFIAESLGLNKGEQPRDTIRRYLAQDFFKDHLKTYKRRPIYWLFSSGKQRAFQCLVYLHRYSEGTLSRMRTEYVIPLQGKISARTEQLSGDVAAATSTAFRSKLTKERDKLIKQQAELQAFDEKLRHYADLRISLDLDDGVKVNYGKFGDLLAEVKAVTGGSDD
jgi:hypothetical protein